MKRYLFPILLVVMLPIIGRCQASYREEIRVWDSTRHAFLKSENGWLNLVGLLWLSEGTNSFGSDATNNIVFPAGSIIPRAGNFELRRGIVTMKLEKQTGITVNGKKVGQAVIFHPDSTELPVSSVGSLRWTIKKTEDKYGIRLRDLNSPAISSFKGVERFPADSTWRVTARLEKTGTGGIMITNVLGQTGEHESPGRLAFILQGKKYTLDALVSGEELYIIFGDATTGLSTYPSGRYLYASKPGPDGVTILDFNKAINPPCAFTEYATCPLPPKQNILPIAILAGEKNYH